MLKILKCRRSSIAVLCLCALTFLGYKKGADVAASIATIALGIAGANAAQSVFKKDNENEMEK